MVKQLIQSESAVHFLKKKKKNIYIYVYEKVIVVCVVRVILDFGFNLWANFLKFHCFISFVHCLKQLCMTLKMLPQSGAVVIKITK